MRGVTACALVAMSASAGTASTERSAEECRHRLDHTLALMENQPLMKEELATGLMWKRLDAEGALEAGEPSDCHRIMDSVENILAPASPDGSEQ